MTAGYPSFQPSSSQASNVDQVVSSHQSFLSRSMFSLMLSNERPLRLLSAVQELACAYCLIVEGALDKAKGDYAIASVSPSFVREAMAQGTSPLGGGGAGGEVSSMKEMGSVLDGTLEALEVRGCSSNSGGLVEGWEASLYFHHDADMVRPLILILIM